MSNERLRYSAEKSKVLDGNRSGSRFESTLIPGTPSISTASAGPRYSLGCTPPRSTPTTTNHRKAVTFIRSGTPSESGRLRPWWMARRSGSLTLKNGNGELSRVGRCEPSWNWNTMAGTRAGERGFSHTIFAKSADDFEFATGLPAKTGIAPVTSAQGSPVVWMATWGEQVVAPGPTATEAVPGQQLGLAIVMLSPRATFANDGKNHLIDFKLSNGPQSWYTIAAWDQEGSNRRVGQGSQKEERQHQSLILPSDAIRSREEFLNAVQERAERMAQPAGIHIVSDSASTQQAPPDTLVPHKTKTVEQAVQLLRQTIDRTALQWEPLLQATSEPISATSGQGFFTEANNVTGEWQKQNGFFWTGSFWTGELWQLYSATRDEKYRRWAELWSSKLISQESLQNHDAGFLYYYSSAMGFDSTHDDALR